MKLKGYRGEIYFHILCPNRRLTYGDERLVEPGRELKARKVGQFPSKSKRPVLCEYGMHACKDFNDTLRYRSASEGSWICLVRLNTEVIHDKNKSVALRRKVVAMRKFGDLFNDEYTTIDLTWMSNKIANDIVSSWILAKPYKGIK